MNLKNKTVIIIGGPTAVGKTSVAINIARHFNTEIISADSRQCYKELNIGVARPSIEELEEVKHHFIASHSILDSITAAGFEAFGLERSAELFKAHNTVVMVGGTGLYIKAFCEGLDEIPGTQPDLRQNITEQYKQNGLLWLQEQIAMLDPAFY
ncbi:MAG TPA: isopentenyl transferase family protein, partial [Flavisolibacter sp.]|nr:isopentenyl transferase family protein [Flavisolibacter sp.]